ncbi:MAG: hypothetical protein LBS54_06050 [Dysgonamonadaceae bacterium]|jgi:hypothetical protein|nr:hypothetical protein [Dysgonamonadaceae bacterium]
MKVINRINALWLLFVLPAATQAQVSIGTKMPDRSALLQVGEYVSPTAGDETSKLGGILLPRVELTDLNKACVISEGSPAEQKTEMTGAIVYNVGTTNGIEEGLYEWDGSQWSSLETETNIIGSTTKKSIKRVTSAQFETNYPEVQMGIFKFRMQPTSYIYQRIPQIALVNSATPYNVWWHVTEYSSGSDLRHDLFYAKLGTANEFKHIAPNNILNPNNVRHEVWVPDTNNNKLYHAQFIIADWGLSVPIYAIIVTEY